MITRALAGFACVTLLAMISPVVAEAQDQETKRSVTVSGEGRVLVEPDIATVRFGIVTIDTDPEEARIENARASREAMNVVRELGIPERKLKLEQLRLQPSREYDPETRRYREVGFEVSRRLVVEVEDLEQLPVLIARVVQKGANRLDGVVYDLSDRESVKNEALRKAVLNAKDKAQLMAETLGAELREVLRIDDQGVQYPGPMRMALEADSPVMLKAEAMPEPEAYAAGELEVTARVGATFAIN